MGSSPCGLDGTIEGVWADAAAAVSYLDGGGRVTARVDGAEVRWPHVTVGADVDEVEFYHLGREDLGLTVRHSFAGGWTVRVTFVSHTLQPLALAAELAWVPASTSPARALAARATGAYAIPGPGGTGPLLGGELVVGTCDAVTGDRIGLGRFDLGPLGRHVVQWRWEWFASPAAFGTARFDAVPRDLVLPAGEPALIAADDDEAVDAPGVDLAHRGGHLELVVDKSATGRRAGQLSSRSDRLRLEWVSSLDEVLAATSEPLMAGPRTGRACSGGRSGCRPGGPAAAEAGRGR